MPSKPRQFAKEKKKSAKHAAEAPQTADDYLAAGVDFEEAGEKWRAGDAAKSMRFFVRAIDTYNEALREFPGSFDLAYNKARVQYEITQHPRLAAQLPGTLLDLLKTALESSHAALNLRQDNADVLFNTAQVLTSLVEAITEDRSHSAFKEDGLRLLEEAIELFQRCLTLQEFHYAESQAQEETATMGPHPQPLEIHDSEASSPLSPSVSSHVTASTTVATEQDDGVLVHQPFEEERWASIIEPVTNDTLLDTVLAQLETLTTLCDLITADEGRGLAWIEEYSTGLLTTKLPTYIRGTDREEEATLMQANFIAALANANFRCQRIDVATYEQALKDAFGKLDLKNDPEGLCEKAEALMAYSFALGTDAFSNSHPLTISSRWNALTSALNSLTLASSLSAAQNLAAIHLLRGDIELLRRQLSQPPGQDNSANKNAATLLQNAGTYYRGAMNHAMASRTRHEEDVEELNEAVVKLALVEALAGAKSKLGVLMEEKQEMTQRVLEDAVGGGLLGMEWLVREGLVNG